MLYSDFSPRYRRRQAGTSNAESTGVLQRAVCRQPRVDIANVAQERSGAEDVEATHFRSETVERVAGDAVGTLASKDNFVIETFQLVSILKRRRVKIKVKQPRPQDSNDMCWLKNMVGRRQLMRPRDTSATTHARYQSVCRSCLNVIKAPPTKERSLVLYHITIQGGGPG